MHHVKQRKGHHFTQAMSADKDDEYNSGFFCLNFPNRNAQNLRRIKQRKGLCFILASSDDKDDAYSSIAFQDC